MITTTPRPSRVNISTGTQRGLTFCSRGMGGVYRPDATPASTFGGAGLPPLGVTRPVVRRSDALRVAMGAEDTDGDTRRSPQGGDVASLSSVRRAHPRHRQLRQLRLQPRAVPRGARRRPDRPPV